eukprot:COSAG02_NODE_6807_length_3350_cov_6.640111_2_plen_360_part_00
MRAMGRGCCRLVAVLSTILEVAATEASLPRTPKLVPIAPAELVWSQHVDACPGVNKFGHVGEQPDSMPLAWHDPLSGRTSLITANDWGTFAKVAPRLSDLRSGAQQADCSHRIFTSINSSDPSTYANHQWMQSVHMWPNGTGISLVHNEFHGDQIQANSSICSYHWPHSNAPNGQCQIWSTGIGITRDGGQHWELVRAPPQHVAFVPPRRYVVDQNIAGFGALGALVQLDGYYYGHVMELKAGRTAASPNSSGGRMHTKCFLAYILAQPDATVYSFDGGGGIVLQFVCSDRPIRATLSRTVDGTVLHGQQPGSTLTLTINTTLIPVTTLVRWCRLRAPALTLIHGNSAATGSLPAGHLT